MHDNIHDRFHLCVTGIVMQTHRIKQKQNPFIHKFCKHVSLLHATITSSGKYIKSLFNFLVNIENVFIS